MLDSSAMAKKHTQVAFKKQQRAGEGAIVHADFRRDVKTSGETAIYMSIDMSEAPVPDRRYVSDALTFVRELDQLKMCFGQRKVVGEGLRTLLVLHMPLDAVSRLNATLDQFSPGL